MTAVRPRRDFAPLVMPSVTSALGALLGARLHLAEVQVIALACAGASVGACVLLIIRGRRAAALVALSMVLGAISASRADRDVNRRPLDSVASMLDGLDPGAPVRLVGTLDQDPEWRRERAVLHVEASAMEARGRPTAVTGRVRLTVRRGEHELDHYAMGYGDRIAVFAKLASPQAQRNPGGFDFKQYLKIRAIDIVGSVKSFVLVDRLGHAPPSLLDDLFHRIRGAGLARIRSVFPGEWPSPARDGALLAAFLLGDRSAIDRRDEEAFLAGGTYHILAISGVHVAMLGALVHGAQAFVGWPGYRLRWVVVGLSMVGYALATEAPPSVVRAAAMGLIMVACRLLGERVSPLHALTLSFVPLVLLWPLDVFDAGFQLTYLATFGIVMTGPFCFRSGRSRWVTSVVAGAVVCVAAQAATLPLIHARFLRLTPGAILVNVPAVPLSGLALALAVAGLALPGVAGDGALRLAAFLLRLIGEASDLVARSPALSFRALAPPAWLLWASFGAMMILAVVIRPEAFLRRRPRGAQVGSIARWLAAVVLVGLLVSHHIVGLWPRAAGDLLIAVLDVGQGDSILVRSPEGKAILIDGGGSPSGDFDVGARVVVPALLSLGVRSLEAVALTHAHSDHGRGLSAVIRQLPVGELWEGVAHPVRAGTFYDDLLSAARERSVRRRDLRCGQQVRLGSATIDVLGPPAGARSMEIVRNDESLVLRLRFGRHVFLFPGDVEASGEARLSGIAGEIDFLKVAHHGSGSSTSDALVRAVRPRIAAISVGRGNPWGFPDEAVLGRLAKTMILRTDREGALLIRSDGRLLRAHTWSRTIEGVGEARLPPRRGAVPTLPAEAAHSGESLTSGGATRP